MKKIIVTTLIYLLAIQGFSQNANDICALNIGNEVPDSKIEAVTGEEVSISEICTEKPTIIIFYRGGWCPYCTNHLSEITEIEDDIIEMGYQVIAISPDDISKIPETMQKQTIKYQLFSDRKYAAMKDFGIAFKPKEERISKYAMRMEMDEENVLVPVPSVFVIKDGVIQYRYVNPKYSARISSEMLISALKSLE